MKIYSISVESDNDFLIKAFNKKEAIQKIWEIYYKDFKDYHPYHKKDVYAFEVDFDENNIAII